MDQNAFRHSVDEVLAALGSDAHRGLTEAEARVRLERHGRNELTAAKPVPRGASSWRSSPTRW